MPPSPLPLILWLRPILGWWTDHGNIAASVGRGNMLVLSPVVFSVARGCYYIVMRWWMFPGSSKTLILNSPLSLVLKKTYLADILTGCSSLLHVHVVRISSRYASTFRWEKWKTRASSQNACKMSFQLCYQRTLVIVSSPPALLMVTSWCCVCCTCTCALSLCTWTAVAFKVLV